MVILNYILKLSTSKKNIYIYIYIHILGHGYLELHFEKSGLFERKGRLSK